MCEEKKWRIFSPGPTLESRVEGRGGGRQHQRKLSAKHVIRSELKDKLSAKHGIRSELKDKLSAKHGIRSELNINSLPSMALDQS